MPPAKIASFDYEEERFQTAIKRSNAATLAVICWLWRSSSWWIKAKPAVARATGCDPAGENTIADIFISKDNNNWLPMEVKHRNLHFASADDYPYPTLFLDRIKPISSPKWYFIVNANRTHAAIVSSEVSRSKTFINDHGKAGDIYEAWECDKTHFKIKWVSLLTVCLLCATAASAQEPSEADKVAALKRAYQINGYSMVGWGSIDPSEWQPAVEIPLADRVLVPPPNEPKPRARVKLAHRSDDESKNDGICARHHMHKVYYGDKWRCRK